MLRNPWVDQNWVNGVNAALAAAPTWPEFNFTYNLAVTLAIAGIADRDITTGTIAAGSLTGLLSTDKIMELQPSGDLPGGFTVGAQRITGNGALRVRFLTPVAVVLSSTAIVFKLTVKRG